MRQFKINKGVGHPFRQDDLEYMFEAQEQIVKGLMSAYNLGSNDSFVISGCEIVNNTGNGTYDVSEGWFCFQGEIMKVDAHQVTNGGSNYVWAVVETNPSTKLSGNSLINPLTYEDGSTVYPYKERKMEYQVSGSQAEKVIEESVFYLQYKSHWVEVTYNAGSSSSSELLYRVYNNHLQFWGYIESLTLDNSGKSVAGIDIPDYLTLPSGATVLIPVEFDGHPHNTGFVTYSPTIQELNAYTFDGTNSYTGTLTVNVSIPLKQTI